MSKILLVGEATWLQTGYATYMLQIARRLVASGHEVGELACYGDPNDPRRAGSPWPAFFLTTLSSDYPPCGFYQSQPASGATVFEEAVLAFKPDIVISARDPWTDAFIHYSPLREFYRWIYMHPVDGEPQDEEWLGAVSQADAVLAYSDYGQNVLARYPGIRLGGVAAPGAEADIFHPVDQKQARKMLGIPADALVVGAVMRNQGRKLYPELFESFSRLLESAPSHISERLFLYCHTAWPDVGWDLPKYLLRYSCAHRCLFTFGCRACNRPFSSLWQEPAAGCPHCGSDLVSTPTASMGLPRSLMGSVYSSMDVCVQYSVCEGFGMPQVESACCATPVMSVDHTAMASVCRQIGGTTIRVGRHFTENETGRILALPDNDHLIQELITFFSSPPALRRASGIRQRTLALQSFDYDLAGQVWKNAVASVPPPVSLYNRPPLKLPEMKRPPEHLQNREWVEQSFMSALGIAPIKAGYLVQRMTRDLNRGYSDTLFVPSQFCLPGPCGRMSTFDRDAAWRIFEAERRRLEFWEGRRR
jgi:hypothetical protein